jgi:hypothetical protein
VRKEWLRFWLSGLVLIVGLSLIGKAQITVPFASFTADTIIEPSEVNANFAKFGDALNRTGGTMTGTLTARDITPDANGTRDLGVTGTRWKDGWFGGTVTAATFSGSGASLTALDASNLASGTVPDARFPATLPAASGANLTSIPETAITDGAVLARVGGTETISGTWTFTAVPKVTAAAAGVIFNQTGGTSGARNWQFYANGDQLQLITGSDAEAFGSNVLVVTRSGTTPTQATFTPRIQATNQPGFLAYNSASDSPVGFPTAVDFDTEVYDTGGNFAADVFTAPVTGTYLLCAGVRFTSATNFELYIATSNRNYGIYDDSGAGVADKATGCVHADMDASDTASVQVGASAITVTGGQSGNGALYTWFSGRLAP